MERLLLARSVVTLDDVSRVAGGVIVRDGMIAAVGAEDDLRRRIAPDAVVTDLGPATIVPGFIDGHNHFCYASFEPVQVDCSTPPIDTLSEVLRRLTEAFAHAEHGSWVRGWGFHWSRVREQRNPTRAELDAASPDRPLVLMDASYHACFVNSAALDLLGIDRHSPPGRNGIIVCDDDGEPTGALLETASDGAQSASWASVVNASLEDAIGLVEANARRHLAAGITSVSDALVTPDAHRLYLRAAEAGRLPITIHEMHGGRTFFEPPRPDLPVDFSYEMHRLRGGTIKMFMDAVHPGPAIDRSNGGRKVHTGANYYGRGEATRLVEEIVEHGLEPAVHVLGDCAVGQGLDAFEAVRSTSGGTGASLRLEHFIVADDTHVERAAALGVKVVANPAFLWQWGDMYLHVWRPEGEDRLRIIPLRSLLDAGVLLAAASDYPCAPFAPLIGMQAAVTRRCYNGEAVDDDQAVTPEEALRMFTSSAALVAGTASEEGTIEAGKRANLVVLDADPLSVDPSEIGAIRVLQTYVDGELAHA